MDVDEYLAYIIREQTNYLAIMDIKLKLTKIQKNMSLENYIPVSIKYFIFEMHLDKIKIKEIIMAIVSYCEIIDLLRSVKKSGWCSYNRE